MSDWIRVQDRLPGAGENVLVVCARNRYSMCVGFMTRALALVYCHETAHPSDLDPITHWMPLPATPEDAT